jgi:hypothetical protein
MNTLIVDAGNSRIKAKRASGHEVDFAHALVEISPAKYHQVLESYGSTPPPADYIRIDDRCYVIGDTAESHGLVSPQTGPGRYSEEYYGALVVSAISRLYKSERMELAVFAAHPPGHLAYTQNLMRSIYRDSAWQIESAGKRIEVAVTYVNVFDEPNGGLMNVMLTEDGAHYQRPELKGARVIVIDVGGGTTDFLVVSENGDIDYGLASSEPLGIINALADFERDLRARYRVEVTNADYLVPARVREALRTGEYRGGGGVLYAHEEAEAARNKLINHLLRIYRTKYGGGLRYDAVLLTGGGSGLLYDYLEPHLQNQNVMLADDADSLHMANVRGGLKLWNLYRKLGVTV